jgi:hypothetical protein
MSPYRRVGAKAPDPKPTRREKKARADANDRARVLFECACMYAEEQRSAAVRREARQLANALRLHELERERSARAAADAAARDALEQAQLEAEMRAAAVAEALRARAAAAAAEAADAEAARAEAAGAARAREEQAAKAMKFKLEVARNKEIAAKLEVRRTLRRGSESAP